MLNINKNISLLFETSWEVCHKVGGIYTVLSTKAAVLEKTFGDRLIFIGPDIWTESERSPYFEEDASLLDKFEGSASVPSGLTVRVGRWDIPSKPIAVLVGFQEEYKSLDTIFGYMWERYGVDSLHCYGDYREGCAFAVAAARTMIAISDHLQADRSKVVCHFNEWTTGMGLLYIQTRCPEMSTLFTTHATSIGRSICSNGKPLYDYFTGYNGDQMAGELNMESKHSLEKAAAHAADCFTAVSELTARECRQLLDIEPQVVTPNGFEFKFVPAKRAYAANRRKARERLLAIASALTGREFTDDSFIVATSGRHEFRNKGLDLFLDSMENLRHRKALAEKQVVAFVLVPGWVRGISAPLKEALDGKERKNIYPDFLTHRLHNEDSDEVVGRIAQMNRNLDRDNMPVIYVPCYLDGRDGIVDISYYDVLPGCDLTVFPSYYEPWGYTPLESIAFGVPTVTTDKSGFGLWILENFSNSFASCGVRVEKRSDSDCGKTVEAVGDDMETIILASEAERLMMAEKAKATASKADWKTFIRNYYKAFAVANDRKAIRLKEKL